MKKAKLPFPVLILISATLFLVSSTLGEWIGGRSSSSRAPVNETVEQQKAAIFYFQVMSWFSQVISHSHARGNDRVESPQPVEAIKSPNCGLASHNLRACALDQPIRPSMSRAKSNCGNL